VCGSWHELSALGDGASCGQALWVSVEGVRARCVAVPFGCQPRPAEPRWSRPKCHSDGPVAMWMAGGGGGGGVGGEMKRAGDVRGLLPFNPILGTSSTVWAHGCVAVVMVHAFKSMGICLCQPFNDHERI